MIPEDGAFNPLTVLVVAPPTDQTGLVRDALAQTGYFVVLREDCPTAWKEVERRAPDLVLLDHDVADCGGCAGCEYCLRTYEQQGSHRVPVLAFLSSEKDAEEERGLSALADDILFHPIHRLELLRRVRSLLRARRLQAEIDHYTQELEEQASALRQLDRMKDEFMAVVSHELRTPLTPVVAYTEMLLDKRLGPLVPQQEEALEIIRTKTQHLHHLIEDILAFATTDRGRSGLSEQIISLDVVLKAEMDAVMPLCVHKGIALVRAWPGDLPPIKGDPQQLRRVLRHLLDNACKFTPAGGRVTVRAYPASSEPPANHHGTQPRTTPYVTVAVEDTGVGIPREKQRHIFDPFYQADSSLTRRYSGLGLGLALAKRILSAYGSSLTVESEEGKGSRFTFNLPAYAPRPVREGHQRGILRVR
ncbi:MAG: hybrid sensor histidine kinase/response regulator [Anaerolineae bacterium]|nr:hybrid sensor histidine kinase/response regulator [Anaerolineae bacterium]